MKIQVLVAAMNQKNHKLLKKMNIQTDAIVSNQCEENYIEKVRYNNHDISFLNFCEKGVGLNRNNALMRANADIVLFADEDIIYVDGYKDIIEKEFAKNCDADMIIFNVKNEDNRKRYEIKSTKRVHKYNCLRYGAVRIAVKLNSIKKKNIYFNLLFGGGTKYGSGEDSIFIYDCISSGMKVYTSPKTILTIPKSQSTWFKGYDEKYFFDKGALLTRIFGKFNFIQIIMYIIKNRNNFGKKLKIKTVYKYMNNGRKDFLNEKR